MVPVTSVGNPFTRSTAQQELYQDGARLAARTSALHRAKTRGRPVGDVIADLAAAHLSGSRAAIIADIGCGRGTSSRILAERLRPRHLLAVDASAAMLADARARLADAGLTATYLQADFHRLPMPDSTCDLAVAAFCLYHSPTPGVAVAEIARILAPGGIAVLVTKGPDSYHTLDDLVASSGLDRDAMRRPSLYATAHSGNLASHLPPSLQAIRLEHEQHEFRFTDLRHVADYLATTPKYQLPLGLVGDPVAITAALRARLPEQRLHTTSTITYLLARRGGEAA